MRNNQNFKRVRVALLLTEDDVVAICHLGGLNIEKDRARRWARSPDAGPRRFSLMSDAEFDAFCAGLPAWAKEQETDND